MTSAASPRAANPKMVESPASMAHASSSYACTEDGYFKRPHTASIDGDIRLDTCWFFVGFGVDGHLTRNQLGESLVRKSHPHHGGRRRPTAAMVPHPRRRRTQQPANMMRDKSMSLKLEDIIVFIIY